MLVMETAEVCKWTYDKIDLDVEDVGKERCAT